MRSCVEKALSKDAHGMFVAGYSGQLWLFSCASKVYSQKVRLAERCTLKVFYSFCSDLQ